MDVKDREIRQIEDRELKLLEDLDKVKQEYAELDVAHIKLRAAEFDKVDVLKTNAELEGKIKIHDIDLDGLKK